MTAHETATPPAAEEPATGGRVLLVTICLASLFAFLISIALSPFFPVIAAEFGTTVSLLGQIPALSMLGAAALGLVGGPLADHFGYRRTMLVGALAVVASALGTALAPSFAVLLVAASLGAVSRAVVQPVALAIAGTSFSGEARRRAVSWVIAALAGVGIVGIPLLTSIEALFGWRSAFLALGGLAAATTLLALRVLPRDAAHGARRLRLATVLGAYAPLVRHPPTLGLLGSSLLRIGGIWTIMTYLSAYLVDQHGLSVQAAGWGYTALGGGFFVGSLVAGGRVGRLPLRPLLIGATLLQGLLLAVPLLLPTSSLAVIGLFSLSAAIGGVSNVAGTMLLTTESPAGRATTMTLNQSAFSGGGALGGAMGGLILAVSGYRVIALGVLACSVAAALLTWLSRPRVATAPARVRAVARDPAPQPGPEGR